MAPISQDWLRHAAKRWAAVQLPLHRSESSVEAVLSAVARWSAHLARRPDGGEDPTVLGKDDITSFLVGLRARVNHGQLGAYAHARTVEFLRRFLRDCRDLAPDERGGPLAGLRSGVVVAPEEVPLLPRRDPDDEIGDAVPDAVVAQLLDDANLGLLSDDGRRRLEIGLEVGRRPGELCRLAFDCLAYDERVTENGSTETKPVLVHDMRKVNVVGCRLPVHEHTAELIADQQAAVRARFPDTPSAELVLFPAIQRPKGGRRPIASTGWAKELRRWVNRLELFEGRLGPDGSLHLLRDSNGALVRFDPARVFPYALRHSYAQRHVNAGTPVEVLKELMGHDCLNTTSAYYRITADRKRRAIKTVMPFQMTVSGVRLALVGEPNDSDLGRYVLSETSVPMGSCVEPSNVRANGAACDFRYRCFGCAHFRTDPSYLPELRAYLSKLLATRERLVAALPDLADWARRDAIPASEEIDTVRRLITACEHALARLDPPDRATVTEAIELLRKGRAEMDTTFPVQFRGMVAQPAPAVFPAVAAETGRSR
jgi:integrase